MRARCILVQVLLTAAAAEDILPIKGIFNIKTEYETIIDTSGGNNDSDAESSGKGDLSKTMELILFRPYIPQLQDFASEILSKNNEDDDLKGNASSTELTEPDEATIDTTTTKQLDHINKRNVDQEYITSDQHPLKYDDSARIDVTSKPFARYEITENVIDVPDDRTPAGPVVHNYSPYRNTPFNLGSPKNDTEVKTETADEDNKNTKSRLSILHIKAEVEEKPNNPSKIKNFFKGFKNYLSGIKTDVVKGINKLFKHDEAAHGKDSEGPDESGDDDDEELDDDADDFAELHQTIHKGFR